MRKTSYIVTFVAVVATLFFNILSVQRPDWLVVKTTSEVLHTVITISYGLTQRCELTVTEIPGPSDRGKITYRDYQCRPFPARVTDKCEEENEGFCAVWTGAGYIDQIGIGFGTIALVAILFGASTHSRRRRIWRAVAGLAALQGLCQVIAFGMITEMYRTSRFQEFERARPGTAYVLNILAWVFSLLVGMAVVVTGVAADHGYRWAAGNRPYHRIES